jgi:glycosyltransferase involved in cell wall biosynthesis
MTDTPRIDILLATWNGERYLVEQIDSVLNQQYPNCRLLIRDDGSSDGTRAIIEGYAAKHPKRITIIEDDEPGLGASGNFSRLMDRAEADYIMLCDQDDFWLPEKVGVTLDEMRRLERAHGADTPLLVHCDLKVADAGLNVIAPSFWDYQRLNPDKGRFLNRLLIQNVVTGCASMMNRRLRDLALPVHDQARMHDWWLALAAAAFGRIGYIRQPLVLYRQHGGNTLGAKKWDTGTLVRLVVTGSLIGVCRQKQEILRTTQRQAAGFAETFADRMPAEHLRVVEAYAAMPEQGYFARRRTLLRHDFLLDGVIKNVGLMVLV